MALTKINNNTLSAVTTLPAAIATGKVLQVVQTAWQDTLQVSINNTYTQITGLNTNITCSSTSNKVLIEGKIYVCPHAGTSPYPAIRLTKGGSVISGAIGNSKDSRRTVTGCSGDGGAASEMNVIAFTYLDSPSSTSELTYGAQITAYASRTLDINYTGGTDANSGAATLSTITLTEIAG